MNKDSHIAILGASGMVGSALERRLRKQSYSNVLSVTRKDVDFCDQAAVKAWFQKNKPEYVFISAAKVGGIQANINSPADFGYINGMIALNILNCCHEEKTKKVLFLGSSCIYPKECPQPMKEEYLLTGKFEPTNELYALSKVYGIRLCQAYKKQYGDNFISCQPCNLHGENDNFDLKTSHVMSSMIAKFHAAKVGGTSVELWGSGAARREFLYVDDCADACIFLMDNYSDAEPINVGSGEDVSIKELSEIVASVVGYKGNVFWNTSKPDGMMKKLLDVTKIRNLGWSPAISLLDGIKKTYEFYLQSGIIK
jgi:GDP-L-fucose synthase